MDKAKITKKINQVGHAIDDHVENTAAKHKFTKFQVWVGLGIGVLAIVGAAKVLGWL
jgi:hypothetical protein